MDGLASDSRPTPLRWGILSTARINTSLIAASASLADTVFLAVASRTAPRASEYAERHGIPRAYGSYEELLADPDLDAVYISLPNDMHGDWTLNALEAGKHVLCEKPISQSAREASQIAGVAEDLRLVVHEAFMYQHLPLVMEARRLVAAGAIGKLRSVHCQFSFTLANPTEDHRGSAAHHGGSLADLGCYCIHLIRSLAGEPQRVYAEATFGWGGVDMQCRGVLRSEDVIGSFECALNTPTRRALEIVGADGVIRVEDPWHATQTEISITRELDADSLRVPVADPYRLELQHMAALIGSGEERNSARELLAQAPCPRGGITFDAHTGAGDLGVRGGRNPWG